MKDTQIPEKTTYEFQSHATSQVTVRATAIPKKDVPPGATIEGVVALTPADFQKAGVYEFDFGDDGTHRIQAAAVL